MKLTRDLAFAAAWDAGNFSMRAAGRKKWSRKDYSVCCAKFQELWPMENNVVLLSDIPWLKSLTEAESFATAQACAESSGQLRLGGV